MTQRIICPLHEEKTPSCILYGEYFKCFGCGASGHVDKIGISAIKPRRIQKEDISSKLEYINNLPLKSIRGLELPYDLEGYYVVYPNVDYYIKRAHNGVADNNKYKSPQGFTKPLMIVNSVNSDPLFIVEGQINALSLNSVVDNVAVVSPGSAVDLAKDKFVHHYLRYKHVVICADLDSPGVKYGTLLQTILVKNKVNAVLFSMREDFNSVLVKHGSEGVANEYKKALAMLRMPSIR